MGGADVFKTMISFPLDICPEVGLLALAGVAQLIEAPFCRQKAHGFDSWSECMPKLGVQSLLERQPIAVPHPPKSHTS